MGINFLIALAAALFSATTVLLGIIGFVKLYKPQSFAETLPPRVVQHLPNQEPHVPFQVQLPAFAPTQIIDAVTLMALSGEQVVSLLKPSSQGAQFLLISDIPVPQRHKTIQVPVVAGFSDTHSFQKQTDEVLCSLAG